MVVRIRLAFGLLCCLLLTAGQVGCDGPPSAVAVEQAAQDRQMGQFLRNQPVPSFRLEP